MEVQVQVQTSGRGSVNCPNINLIGLNVNELILLTDNTEVVCLSPNVERLHDSKQYRATIPCT